MKKNIEGRKAVLETVSKNGRELENFPEFQDDREIVMAAVSQHGMALEYADDVLKNNHDIIETACTQNPLSFQFAKLDLVPKERDLVISVMNKLEQLGKEENKKLINDCKYYLFLINEVHACDSDDDWESNFADEPSSGKKPSR